MRLIAQSCCIAALTFVGGLVALVLRGPPPTGLDWFVLVFATVMLGAMWWVFWPVFRRY